MKKILFTLLALVALACTTVTFSSCGDDDSTSDNFDAIKNELQGTWKGTIVTGTSTTSSSSGTIKTNVFTENYTLKFSGNQMTLVAVDKDNKSSSYTFTIGQSYGGGDYYLDFGSAAHALFFKVNGSSLTFTSTNGSDWLAFTNRTFTK